MWSYTRVSIESRLTLGRRLTKEVENATRLRGGILWRRDSLAFSLADARLLDDIEVEGLEWPWDELWVDIPHGEMRLRNELAVSDTLCDIRGNIPEH